MENLSGLGFNACDLPVKMHPVSREFLQYFLEGKLTPAEFLRVFSLPNSDYLPLAECLVRLLG